MAKVISIFSTDRRGITRRTDMTFTTRLDHAQRLVVFHGKEKLSQEELSQALKLFRDPDFPSDYDILNLFDEDIRVEINHDSIVSHAIERQRTLIEREPGRQLRSAFVAVPPALKALLDLWPLFFPETDGSLLIRFFDTLEEALAWLEREPFDVAALEDFPVQPL